MAHNFWGLKAIVPFQIVYSCILQLLKNHSSSIEWKYLVSSDSLTAKET